MKKRALIVAGGTPPSDKLLKREVSRADLVIAADSGADPLVNMEIEALTLIGDFDSISPKVLETYRKKQVEILTSNTHKDETDTLLAMDAAIARGATRVTVLGALGKRLDHQYANIALLLYAKKRGITAELKDDTTWVFLAKKNTCFETALGANVSIFAITKRCVFLSSKGLAYSLNGLKLYRNKPIGVSNTSMQEKVCFELKTGMALVMVTE